MTLDATTLSEIKNVLDDRYVLQGECHDRQEEVSSELAKEDKRIEVISHDFKIIKWLVTTVAASSIGALVTSVLDIMLR